MDEMVDIVDVKDNVIGKVTRKEAHAKGLLHRVVHVVIENSNGEILCLKRGKNVDTRPGYISNCAGHVQAGENYEETVKREMEEELGIKANPKFVGKVIVYEQGPGTHNTLIGCFKAKHNGPFKIDESELEKAYFKDLKFIKEDIAKGEKYSLSF